MVEASCLYRAVTWQRLHNCKISASIGNFASLAKRCAAGEKLRPAGKAGWQPSGDGQHTVSQKRVVPFKRGPSAFAEASTGRIPATIPKEDAVFGSAQARFPTDIAQGTRRAGAADGGQAGRRKRSAARKPLSVCGLRYLSFSAVREPPASFRQRRKSCAVTRLLPRYCSALREPAASFRTARAKHIRDAFRRPPLKRPPAVGRSPPENASVETDAAAESRPQRGNPGIPPLSSVYSIPTRKKRTIRRKKELNETWASASASSAASRS